MSQSAPLIARRCCFTPKALEQLVALAPIQGILLEAELPLTALLPSSTFGSVPIAFETNSQSPAPLPNPKLLVKSPPNNHSPNLTRASPNLIKLRIPQESPSWDLVHVPHASH